MKVRKIYFYKFLSIFIITGVSFVLYLNFSSDQIYSPSNTKKRGDITESNEVTSNFSLNQGKFLSHAKHKDSGDDQETSVTTNSYSNTIGSGSSGSTQPYSSESYNEDLANSQYQDYHHNYENSVVSNTSNNNGNYNAELAMPTISLPASTPNSPRDKDQRKEVTTNKSWQAGRPSMEAPMDLPYCPCGTTDPGNCVANPGCNEPPEEIPLDGHEYLLIFAGIVLGIKKLKKGFK